MKFSLILPIYNVEQYLSRCIDSCLQQNLAHDEYEILLVVDGSPDNSINIAKKYAKTYTNITVVERENGGLSAARNTGLKKAKGDYIWFIDSDDYIEPNVLALIFNCLEKDHLDCLWIRWLCVDDKDNKLPEYAPFKNSSDTSVMKGNQFAAKSLSTYLHAWSFIYKRSFLEERGLLFKEGMSFEDCEFAFKAIPQIDRVRLLDKVCYYYVQRKGSIVHTLDERKLVDIRENIKIAFQQHRKSLDNSLLSAFYKKNYSVLLIMEIKEIARMNDRWLSFDNLKKFISQEGINDVYVLGNNYAKAISLIFNYIGIRAAFVFALLLTIIRGKKE